MAGKKVEEQPQPQEMPEVIQVKREDWQALMQTIGTTVVYMQAAPLLQRMQELATTPISEG